MTESKKSEAVPKGIPHIYIGKTFVGKSLSNIFAREDKYEERLYFSKLQFSPFIGQIVYLDEVAKGKYRFIETMRDSKDRKFVEDAMLNNIAAKKMSQDYKSRVALRHEREHLESMTLKEIKEACQTRPGLRRLVGEYIRENLI